MNKTIRLMFAVSLLAIVPALAYAWPWTGFLSGASENDAIVGAIGFPSSLTNKMQCDGGNGTTVLDGGFCNLPSVTLQTGSAANVTFSSVVSTATQDAATTYGPVCGVAVSGATTIPIGGSPAIDAGFSYVSGYVSLGSTSMTVNRTVHITQLTPGINTFTMQCSEVFGGTDNFGNNTLIVEPIGPTAN